MKRIIISLWLGLGLAYAGAQQKPKEEKKIIREVRVLVAGERQPPAYEQRGDQWVEVNPDHKLIPPCEMELPVAEGDKEKKKEPIVMRFSLNQLFRVSGYEGESSMRIRLKNSRVKGMKEVEVTAKLGEMEHPLILISSDRSGKGWAEPRVEVVDVSEQSLAAGSVLVVNYSKWPLRMTYGGDQKEFATGIIRAAPKKASKEMMDIRLEMKTQQSYVSLFNSQYTADDHQRMIVFVDDAQKVTKNVPPLFVRITADSVEYEKPVKKPE